MGIAGVDKGVHGVKVGLGGLQAHIHCTGNCSGLVLVCTNGYIITFCAELPAVSSSAEASTKGHFQYSVNDTISKHHAVSETEYKRTLMTLLMSDAATSLPSGDTRTQRTSCPVLMALV